MPAPTPPTSYETGTAEAWLTVLDYVSRVAQAVEGGDWYYLADKSDALERAIGALRRRVWDEDARRLDVEDPTTGKPLRAEAVMEVVRRNAGLYRASRALYVDAAEGEGWTDLAPPEWWGVAEAASHCGILPDTWRGYVARGRAPRPDDPDEGAPKQRRRPRWRAETVTAWQASRPRAPRHEEASK